MERQAWILRSFLAQLHVKEAEDDETDRGFAGEFMVSDSLRLASSATCGAVCFIVQGYNR